MRRRYDDALCLLPLPNGACWYTVGTMKIDHPDTPFLFLDADDPCGEVAAIHPKYLSTHIPMAERTGAHLCGRGPSPMWGTRPFGRLASPTRPAVGRSSELPRASSGAGRACSSQSWPNLGRRRCLPHRCARASPDASKGPAGRLGVGHDGRGWAGELHPSKVGAHRSIWSAAAG